MRINDFRTVQVDQERFPATTALQGRLAAAVVGDAQDIDAMCGALAQAVLDLEVALAKAHAEQLNVKAYVLELEARVLNAGLELDDPAREL